MAVCCHVVALGAALRQRAIAPTHRLAASRGCAYLCGLLSGPAPEGSNCLKFSFELRQIRAEPAPRTPAPVDGPRHA